MFSVAVCVQAVAGYNSNSKPTRTVFGVRSVKFLDGEYVAVGLEYAYYTRLRGANGIHGNTHVFHAV